ncbi:hypothetical protein SERLADRAFT_404822 [Serpula lacrymans var. lacrymans S7.9]|uniref:DUF6532 domain-containing protein n=1 Tax=Serpula lacrymans var. lacrymans (strain S7.9) TaxID=578457 RepID=F8NFA2_SERL9|nr:uncharacterized protein SERLADRAFT_404822 [Serpula lacrymans var. lacrymans S7.9]EGO30816.1 hypothetical protein SERLADRAFT_404822 [Serpula lacrymans var. lacrymans S7.9]
MSQNSRCWCTQAPAMLGRTANYQEMRLSVSNTKVLVLPKLTTKPHQFPLKFVCTGCLWIFNVFNVFNILYGSSGIDKWEGHLRCQLPVDDKLHAAGDKMSEYAILSLALNSIPDSLSTVSTMQKSPISQQSPANKLFKTGIQLANAQHWVSFYDTTVNASLNPHILLHQLGYELLAPMAFFLPRPYSPPLSDSQDYLEPSERDSEDEHLTVQQKSAKKEKIHDCQANNVWTECEQECAEKGNRVNDIDNLQSQGHKAPSDIPSSMLDRVGCMQTHLPEECQMLEQIVSILPGNHNFPASPFLSLVININVQTKAHCDSKDQEFCLVLPIRTFRGAALVMVETGLVIELNHGDFVIFRLSDFTYLNLHYEAILRGIVRSYSYSDQNACPKLCGLVNFDGRVQSTQAAQKEALEAKCIVMRKRAASYMEKEEEQDLNDIDTVTPSNPPIKKQAIDNASDEEDFQGVLIQKPHIDVDGLILDDQMGKKHRITLDMFPSHLLDLATAGHAVMRLLINASKGRKDLQAKLLEVWSAVAQVQGEIVAKARLMINGAYHISGDMAPAQIKEVARTFNKQKPFSYQIFKIVRYPEHFKGIPLALLAIITTAVFILLSFQIECSLRAYMNGNKATLEFSENFFKTSSSKEKSYLDEENDRRLVPGHFKSGKSSLSRD